MRTGTPVLLNFGRGVHLHCNRWEDLCMPAAYSILCHSNGGTAGTVAYVDRVQATGGTILLLQREPHKKHGTSSPAAGRMSSICVS
eukprot:scaffold450924_cov59-Attheya_sp.AAC.1